MTSERFFEEIKGKTVAFIGIGVSHKKLIEVFAKKGIKTLACDKHALDYFEEDITYLEKAGATLCLEEDYTKFFEADIVFRTPGMNIHSPELSQLRKQGKVVTSEMEVFFELCPCKKIGVTGSDGKTTTTTIISELLKEQGYTVHLGGNIGTPLLYKVEEMKPSDIAVVELSSFQLISMRTSPDIAIVTNVEPNHLDVHKTMDEYIEAKMNLVIHQNAFSKTILNTQNTTSKSFESFVRGEVSYFNNQNLEGIGSFVNKEGVICYKDYEETHTLFHKEKIKIPGEHNVENFLAAIAAVWGMVDIEVMEKVAQTFGGVEHRIEFVREVDGVSYYNDSIASSPSRTIAGLNSFDRKIVMIAGGYDKKIPFEPLAPKIIEKVKLLILMGKTGPVIKQAVTSLKEYRDSGLQIVEVSNMEEAVQKARELTQRGDIVSLSPASASFDLYRNFEHRGRHFKDLVRGLEA